jgi:hypothetical protein
MNLVWHLQETMVKEYKPYFFSLLHPTLQYCITPLSCIKGADFGLTDEEIERLDFNRSDSVTAGHATGAPL